MLGADLAYLGTRFIATRESMAPAGIQGHDRCRPTRPTSSTRRRSAACTAISSNPRSTRPAPNRSDRLDQAAQSRPREARLEERVVGRTGRRQHRRLPDDRRAMRAADRRISRRRWTRPPQRLPSSRGLNHRLPAGRSAAERLSRPERTRRTHVDAPRARLTVAKARGRRAVRFAGAAFGGRALGARFRRDRDDLVRGTRLRQAGRRGASLRPRQGRKRHRR